MAMLPLPPKKYNPALTAWFYWRMKKNTECQPTYFRERNWLWEEPACDCVSNSGSPHMDAVGSFKKKSSAFGTAHYLNQDNPMPDCPYSYAPQNERRQSIKWVCIMIIKCHLLRHCKDKHWLNYNSHATGNNILCFSDHLIKHVKEIKYF